jgi:hypothetical protein
MKGSGEKPSFRGLLGPEVLSPSKDSRLMRVGNEDQKGFWKLLSEDRRRIPKMPFLLVCEACGHRIIASREKKRSEIIAHKRLCHPNNWKVGFQSVRLSKNQLLVFLQSASFYYSKGLKPPFKVAL